MRKSVCYNITARKEVRQHLRNHATSAEVELWKLLRKRQVCGLKFRRQFGVGPYVLDFYCPALRLAIELDGVAHDTPEAVLYDKERTAWLTGEFGIRVLRFRNERLFETPDGVIEEIKKVVEELGGPSQTPTPTLPLSTGGGRWISRSPCGEGELSAEPTEGVGEGIGNKEKL